LETKECMRQLLKGRCEFLYLFHVRTVMQCLSIIHGHLMLPSCFLDHRKCQEAHSGTASGRQGLGQSRALVRRYFKNKTPGEILPESLLYLICYILLLTLQPVYSAALKMISFGSTRLSFSSAVSLTY